MPSGSEQVVASPSGPDRNAGGDERRVTSILVISGEHAIRELLAVDLALEGYHVITATEAESGVALARAHSPALILLDMDLPAGTATEVFRTLTTYLPACPVIMMSTPSATVDVANCLEAGAADLMVKPLRSRELVARIRAVLRRIDLVPHTPVAAATSFSVGPITIDLSTREARSGGRLLDLSRKEFDLLALLVSQGGRVVTRQQCIDRIWRDASKADSRTLDTHVKRLRKKIEATPSDPVHLVTVRSIGFRFKA